MVSVEKQTSGTKYAWKKYGTDETLIASTQDGGTPLTTKDDQGENIFKLKPGQRMVIEVPKNKDIEIEEVPGENKYKYVTAWHEYTAAGGTSHATPRSGEGTKIKVKLDGNATIIVTNTPEGEITLKKAAVGSAVPLPGARFQICKYNDVSAEWETVSEYTDIDMTDIGIFPISGLVANAKYRLEELTPPPGYIIRERYIYFTFKPDRSLTLTDEQGELIQTNTDSIAVWDKDTKTLTVFNAPGVVLPSTGGPGTVIYTAAGLSLMSIALWMFFRRRREQQH